MGACSFCAFKSPGRPLADYNKILEDQIEPTRGESHIYRSQQMAVGKKAPMLARSEATLQDLFIRNVEQYPDKPFLGYRKLDHATGLPEKKITFKNWAEMDTVCRELGSGVLNLNLVPEISEFRDYKLRFIAIYAGNAPEWIHTDHATNCYGLTTIPLFDEMASETTIHIFRRTNVQTVFTTKKHLKEIVEMLKSGEEAFKCIKNIVILKGQEVFDLGDDTPNYKENLSYLKSETNLSVYLWDEVLDAGRKNLQPFADITTKHVFTLIFTSGTTGEPKAAMIESGAMTTLFEQTRQRAPETES
jgi:long-chain acyl-CoA synthetase